MAGEFSTEQTESGRAYSPVLSNPQFKDLWNIADIQALNRREQAQVAQLPTDFYSPSRAAGIIARDAGGLISSHDQTLVNQGVLPGGDDLLQSLRGAQLDGQVPIQVAQVHRLDDQPLVGLYDQIPYKEEPKRGTKPFADSGKNMQPGDPDSWTFPTAENYKGWLPGDFINPFTWAEESSKYIQEIMKQNFVVEPDGKRVSIFNLKDDEFKKQFGNAARHALGMGDLIFVEGMSPNDALNGMWLHEPPGLANALLKSALARSWKPYNTEKADSDADIQNNEYAAKKAPAFHDFYSFARQMLNDSWNSATKSSWVIDVSKGGQ